MGIHGRGILGSHIEGEDIMKLTNLFLITALIGVVAAIGCSSDPAENGNGGSGGNGTAGTGGNGGGTGGSGGADPCTGGECENDQARKDACGIGIEYCNSLGAGGEGGSGGAVDPTPEQCGAVGTAICNVDTGAGGNGGAGGNPGGCDWTALEICALCELSGGIQDCENEFVACLLLDLGGNECEKCSGAALLECFE
jgi:hypothetical protein